MTDITTARHGTWHHDQPAAPTDEELRALGPADDFGRRKPIGAAMIRAAENAAYERAAQIVGEADFGGYFDRRSLAFQIRALKHPEAA